MTANVADLVASAAANAGGRTAIVDPDGTVTTWDRMDARVDAVADGLRRDGVAEGDRVAIVLPNGSAFAAAFWGALRAGATVVPVNPAYTAPERDYILADSSARWSFTPESDQPQRLIDRPAGSAPAGNPYAVICYTSGTTGRPKGARLTHQNLLANLDSFSDLPLLTLDADDVLLGLLPFFHVFGLNVVLNAAARHAASVVAVDRFSPRSTAETMTRTGVTIAYGAPPVFAALAGAGVALPTLRAAVSGADSLPVSVWERFREVVGLEIVEGYGLTETSPVLASNAAAGAARPGSVGIAVPGVSLRLVGPAGEVVQDGSEGEIHASGPNVFDGYHGRPEETAEVLRDGWFATGDVGAFDADGYLRIVGRLKDMVIVSGFNVYPREVEDTLLAHPDVAEAAVVGVPDPRTGEQVRAAVVANPGAEPSPEALLAFCRERLARYKLPREIRVLDTLPRLATGKVARSILRD